ncbi:hypothetical protein Tco_1565822, partial [Tanacetum coccineum]
TNVAQNAVDENLLQLLTQEEVLMLQMFLILGKLGSVFLDGFEPYLLKTLEDGPFVPMLSLSSSDNPLPFAKTSKSMCKTVKSMWNDFILAHEGPSDIRDTKIVALRLKFNAFKSLEGEKVNGTFTRIKYLLNDLENNGVIIPQSEIYESETQRFTIQASSSKALISNNQFQDSDSDIKEDQRTSNEFMAYLKAEFHERALLANQKMFYKRSGWVGPARKPIDKSKETYITCGKLGKYKGLKAEMTVLTKRIDDLTKGKSKKGKNEKGKSDKGLIDELFDWDE